MRDNYHGEKLPSREVEFLMDLEKIEGKEIPKVKELKIEKSYIDPNGKQKAYLFNIFGFTVQDDKIEGLNLISREFERSIDEFINSGVRLSFLPESIGNLTSLKFLHLTSNQLIILPESIKNLEFLEILEVNYNQIEKLPDSIGILTNLKKIDLEHNRLTSLSESIGNLHNLEVLNLNSNLLESLPESIGNLQNLKQLDLRINSLKVLPESFGNLKCLEGLNLDTNFLKSVPKSFKKLNSLKKLILTLNKFDEIPVEIVNLRKLESLLLNRNNVTQIPKVIDKMSSLKILNITLNKIKEVPKAIGKIKTLESLYLRSNSLSNLPGSLSQLPSLTTLDLGFNSFTQIPQCIANNSSIKYLFLDGNKISVISEITKLEHLEGLHLGNNQIDSIPSNIGILTNLKSLNLSNNYLTTFPQTFWNLNLLEGIDLSNNEFLILPDEIIKLRCLKRLRIRNNKFTKLPSILWKMQNIELLDIKENPWRDDWNPISEMNLKEQLDFCKKREPINIIILLSPEEEEIYRISELVSFILSQEEVSNIASINTFNLTEPSSWSNILKDFQLALFVASQNSLFKSGRVKEILNRVKEQYIQVIPIKGSDVSWGELAEVGLSRELGIEFSENNFGEFCDNLYKYIGEFKHAVDLIDKEEGIYDKSILEFKILFKEYVNSEQFRNLVLQNVEAISSIKAMYDNGELSYIDYIGRLGTIFQNTN